MKEIWKEVLGCEGYKVSNLGRAKSLNYRRTGEEHILKLNKCGVNHAYRSVRIGSTRLVHRLVWEAFNGPIPEGMVINHKDENPSNNNLDNLMLCSQSENLRWMSAQERRQDSFSGNNKRRWVIKLNLNNEILHFYKSASEADKAIGLTRGHVSRCCRGERETAGGFIWKYAE